MFQIIGSVDSMKFHVVQMVMDHVFQLCCNVMEENIVQMESMNQIVQIPVKITNFIVQFKGNAYLKHGDAMEKMIA